MYLQFNSAGNRSKKKSSKASPVQLEDTTQQRKVQVTEREEERSPEAVYIDTRRPLPSPSEGRLLLTLRKVSLLCPLSLSVTGDPCHALMKSYLFSPPPQVRNCIPPPRWPSTQKSQRSQWSVSTATLMLREHWMDT